MATGDHLCAYLFVLYADETGRKVKTGLSNSLDDRLSTYFSKRLKIRQDWAVRGLRIFL